MSWKQVSRELTKSALALVASWGAYRLIERLRGPRVHVLGYHRVVDDIDLDGPVNPSLCVTTATFRRQMEQVRSRFTVLTLEQAAAAITGALPLDRDACAITFDDGYRDVLARAHPILSELGIPATVFVPSGYVGSGRHLTHDRLYAAFWSARRRGLPLPFATPLAAVEGLIAALPARALEETACELESRIGGDAQLDPDARVLDASELRTLASAGWEIGAHTVGHIVLTHEPAERARDELERAKQDLERWTGRACRYFAYCNGYHSRALVEMIERAGYAGAVTTCDRPNGLGGDRFRISRKVLWEGHTRGLDGRFSERLSAAALHDLFGELGLTLPISGETPAPLLEVRECA